VLGEGNEPLRLVDRATGNAVHLEVIDDDTGEIVDRRMLRHTPGPAFSQVDAGRGT